MKDVEVGLNISATLNFMIIDKVLIVTVEVDIGIRPDLLTPTIQVLLVDHWVLWLCS